MCDLPSSITLEHQRDESIRGRELLLTNRGSAGEEYGVLLYCFDDGHIALRVDKEDESPRFIRIGVKLG